ncbi:ASCH domain-containing protein [Miniphocaeibacter halophilus]|uniref:ASCH domain-containing protein n=1 Tax=Miniphocaeibacter halophilus TaxID=2931922 RepID=A0AC61N0A2_9FIRM|nr:ASCH domain-containing protein [Miniphocaeibacter halophilus]QQK08471.1 ASCH domain-containing protein [Miniphocaeibacter halophilus]
MTSEKLWKEYKKLNKDIGEKYDTWAFGTSPDKLLELVLSGEKTGTSSLYRLYEFTNESIPKEGEYSIILNSKGKAICIVKNTKVEIIPFKEIRKEHAFKEGEGDKSLNYWKKVHREFFIGELNKLGEKFSEDILVVFEEFKLMYSIKNQ